MYMMVTSELPFFMTCANNAASVSLAGPGGVHPDSTLAPESTQRWRPPLPITPASKTSDALKYALGQVSGSHPPLTNLLLFLVSCFSLLWVGDRKGGTLKSESDISPGNGDFSILIQHSSAPAYMQTCRLLAVPSPCAAYN